MSVVIVKKETFVTVPVKPIQKTVTVGIVGLQGAKGAPFTFEDFTPEQLEQLRGPQGLPGPQGQPGSDGKAPVYGVDYFTQADKQQIVDSVKSSFAYETWSFTLEDGSVVNKQVLVK